MERQASFIIIVSSGTTFSIHIQIHFYHLFTFQLSRKSWPALLVGWNCCADIWTKWLLKAAWVTHCCFSSVQHSLLLALRGAFILIVCYYWSAAAFFLLQILSISANISRLFPRKGLGTPPPLLKNIKTPFGAIWNSFVKFWGGWSPMDP